LQKDWLPRQGTRIGATFYVRQSQPWLSHYFGVDQLEPTLAPGIGGVVLWGGRIPAKAARLIASLRGVPFWFLEDGFLRSVGLGKQNALPISIQIDDLGMPVRASTPSRLERLIGEAAASEEAAALGGSIREALVQNRLSKYNNLPHRAPKIETTSKRRILLVDQVFGDVSVPMAGGSAESFSRMLADAVASGAQCVVRTHPDVMAGFRKGYMTEQAAKTPGVILSSEAVSAASLLDVVDEVWTMSSQFGLDALLRGLPVRCYAAPFYAGWGLTEDRFDPSTANVAGRRQARPTIDQLAAAAFSLYPVYRETVTWREIDVFAAIEALVAERKALGLD
jgi:capsular polysaccharide export protein